MVLNPDKHEEDLRPDAPLQRLDSLWIHGAGLSGDTWDEIRADCPRARALDLPGHGTASLVSPVCVENYADALSGFVTPGVVLVGHSLGGMVALELAARASLKIAALILVESMPTVRYRLSGTFSAVISKAVFGTIPMSTLISLAGLGESQKTRSELTRQLKQVEKVGFANALEAVARYDGRPRLSQIKIPTLVIVGKRNIAAHQIADFVARNISGAELVKLPGGHMLHIDHSKQLKRCIEAFLQRTVLSKNVPPVCS